MDPKPKIHPDTQREAEEAIRKHWPQGIMNELHGKAAPDEIIIAKFAKLLQKAKAESADAVVRAVASAGHPLHGDCYEAARKEAERVRGEV